MSGALDGTEAEPKLAAMTTTTEEAPAAASPASLPAAKLSPLSAPTTQTGYRYIVKTPGVRGGNARIENTRIGVHDVVAIWILRNSIEEILADLPDLTRAQVYECLAYYEDNREEVEPLARQQMAPPPGK